jgi:hypothetical protein
LLSNCNLYRYNLDAQLFTHLAGAVQSHLQYDPAAFNAQELTNIAW